MSVRRDKFALVRGGGDGGGGARVAQHAHARLEPRRVAQGVMQPPVVPPRRPQPPRAARPPPVPAQAHREQRPLVLVPRAVREQRLHAPQRRRRRLRLPLPLPLLPLPLCRRSAHPPLVRHQRRCNIEIVRPPAALRSVVPESSVAARGTGPAFGSETRARAPWRWRGSLTQAERPHRRHVRVAGHAPRREPQLERARVDIRPGPARQHSALDAACTGVRWIDAAPSSRLRSATRDGRMPVRVDR
ncbi:hypothetical protein MSG28_007822 [Choristoneura fumiferana]|uniref:Uncharacterized protein n=1 Tax=Choristoneura fumiferana TaxID=7141 RepID=A0ACC0JZA1_CHOFU|nr:hypothetical protein MSG28_007822 [Choristoneura fumiferana]